MSDTEDRTNFKGKRQLISFLSWLDYCDQLIQVAHAKVAAALSRTIRKQFLEDLLEPAILQTWVIPETYLHYILWLGQM